MEGRILHRATEGSVIFRDNADGSYNPVYFVYPFNLDRMNPQISDELIECAKKIDAVELGEKANQNSVRFEFIRYVFGSGRSGERWNLILNDKRLHVFIIYDESYTEIKLEMGESGLLMITAPKAIDDQDIFRFLLKNPNWQIIKSKFFGLHVGKLFEVDQDDTYDTFLLSVLRSELKELVEKYCKKINYDHNEVFINIMDAEATSSGGCSAACGHKEKYINFARELIYASREFLEQTVAHEVCHLIHNHHEKDFWDLMSSIYNGKPRESINEVHFAMDVKVASFIKGIYAYWDLSALTPAPVMQKLNWDYDKVDGTYALFDLGIDSSEKLPNRLFENGGYMYFGGAMGAESELEGDNANSNGLVIRSFPDVNLDCMIREAKKAISFVMKSIDLTNEKNLAKLKFSG